MIRFRGWDVLVWQKVWSKIWRKDWWGWQSWGNKGWRWIFFVKAGIYAYHISKSICSNTCHHIIFCLFNAKSLSQDNFINCPLLEVFFGPKVCPVKGPTTKTLSGEFGTSKASTSSLGSSGWSTQKFSMTDPWDERYIYIHLPIKNQPFM